MDFTRISALNGAAAVFCLLLLCGCGDNAAGPASPPEGSGNRKTAASGQSGLSVQLPPPESGAAERRVEVESSDEDLLIRERGKAYEKIKVLAGGDLKGALRLANEMTAAGDYDERLPLEPLLATALHQALFGNGCSFTPEQLAKLRGILDSELNPAVKNELLMTCSRSAERNADAVVRVLDCALEWNQVGPKTLPSIYFDFTMSDPRRASAHLFARPWTPELGPSAARVFAEYIMSNPEEGSAALLAARGAVSPAAWQWAAAGVVQALQEADPEAAGTWREEITDPGAAGHADTLTYSPRRPG